MTSSPFQSLLRSRAFAFATKSHMVQRSNVHWCTFDDTRSFSPNVRTHATNYLENENAVLFVNSSDLREQLTSETSRISQTMKPEKKKTIDGEELYPRKRPLGSHPPTGPQNIRSYWRQSLVDILHSHRPVTPLGWSGYTHKNT